VREKTNYFQSKTVAALATARQQLAWGRDGLSLSRFTLEERHHRADSGPVNDQLPQPAIAA
jgi:hypothetical protein